jgi:hypothetical protein
MSLCVHAVGTTRSGAMTAREFLRQSTCVLIATLVVWRH